MIGKTFSNIPVKTSLFEWELDEIKDPGMALKPPEALAILTKYFGGNAALHSAKYAASRPAVWPKRQDKSVIVTKHFKSCSVTDSSMLKSSMQEKPWTIERKWSDKRFYKDILKVFRKHTKIYFEKSKYRDTTYNLSLVDWSA